MSTDAIARLSCARLQRIVSDKTGRVWTAVRDAVRDNTVTGSHLKQHMGSDDTLRQFFLSDLDCILTPLVASDLYAMLIAASTAPASADDEDGGSAGAGSAGAGGADRGGGAETHERTARAFRDAVERECKQYARHHVFT